MEEELLITWIENSLLLMEKITSKMVYLEILNILSVKLIKKVVEMLLKNSDIRFHKWDKINQLIFLNIGNMLMKFQLLIIQKFLDYMLMLI